MPSRVYREQSITVGESTLIDSVSPKTPYSVVFEDDGETG
jgi:hypothetical protein